MDAIREFAGEDCTRAVLYANDEQYFLRWDERVEHFEVTSLEGLNQQVAPGSQRDRWELVMNSTTAGQAQHGHSQAG